MSDVLGVLALFLLGRVLILIYIVSAWAMFEITTWAKKTGVEHPAILSAFKNTHRTFQRIVWFSKFDLFSSMEDRLNKNYMIEVLIGLILSPMIFTIHLMIIATIPNLFGVWLAIMVGLVDIVIIRFFYTNVLVIKKGI